MLLEAQQIQQIGVPNKNNRIYPLKVIEDIIKVNAGMPIIGTVGMPDVVRELGYPFDLIVSMDDASHVANNLAIKDNWLVADICVLDNISKGKKLHSALTRGEHIDFRMAGYCRTTESTVATDIQEVTEFLLCSINAVADGA